MNDNLGIDPRTEIFSRYLPFKRPVWREFNIGSCGCYPSVGTFWKQ